MEALELKPFGYHPTGPIVPGAIPTPPGGEGAWAEHESEGVQVIGLNTRRYHGLLTAATKPPVGRFVLERPDAVGVMLAEPGESRVALAVDLVESPVGHAEQAPGDSRVVVARCEARVRHDDAHR